VFERSRHCSVLATHGAAGAALSRVFLRQDAARYGIRVGYCHCTRRLTAELRKVHNSIPSASRSRTGNCGVSAAGARILEKPIGFFKPARPSARGPRGQWIHTPGRCGDVFPATRFKELDDRGDRNLRNACSPKRCCDDSVGAFYRWAAPVVVRLCIAKRDERSTRSGRLRAFAKRLI